MSNGSAIACDLGQHAVFGMLGGAVDVLAGPLALLQRAMLWGIWLNLVLAIFNLIPVPPFDGAHILAGLAPAYGRWLRSVGDPRLFVGVLLVVFLGLSQVDGGITAPAAAGDERAVA